MIFQGNEDLQKLRYLNCIKMAASSSKINPSEFPPTERKAWFHLLTTHLQVWEWKTLKDGPLLQVTDCGWKFENGEAVPIMTDQVISFHYSRYRGAIQFLLLYGSPCSLIIVGRGDCIVIILGDSLYPYCQVIKYDFCCSNYLNTFVPNVKFLYPLKTLEKLDSFLMFSRCNIGKKWITAS